MPGQGDCWSYGCAVSLEWTTLAYGRLRAWFLCPGCRGRVAILYVAGASYLACRKCLGLAYASQREDFHDRALRRAEKIRRRLGWPIGIANPKGFKPKGMHWSTFDRLQSQHDHCANAAVVEALRQLRGKISIT